MAQQIQLRRGTAVEWAAANPILALAEIGVELVTLKVKIGDGVTHWNALPYAGIPGPQGPASTVPGPQGQQGDPGTTNYNDLQNKPDLSSLHTHANQTALSNVSGVNTGDQDLSGKENANANIQAHVTSAHAPSNAQKNSDITKPEIEAKLTGEISTHTHVGGGGGLGYAINVQALTFSPGDGATIYFGTLPKAPVTAAGTSKIYIPKAGTIKCIEIYCYSGTAGTAEAWSLYVRKNNTTDTLIATLSVSTSERRFSNAALSIVVVAGDYVEIKAINPTWATNPLTTIFGGFIYIE